MNERWLVTGAAGFIGSHFVEWALQTHENFQIVSFDVLTYAGRKQNLAAVDPQRHRLVTADIRDRREVEAVLTTHTFNRVVHFAAESHVDRSIDRPDDFVTTNVHGTFELLEGLRRQQARGSAPIHFHHVSTDEVYGAQRPKDPAVTESAKYAPNSPYAATKAGSDHLVRSFGKTYDMHVTLSHGSNTYGPRQHPEKFIPTILHHAVAGTPIPIYGDGAQRRDWLYVTDHCAGIGAILERGIPGESYNLAGGNECSNRELAERVCGALDSVLPDGAPHARALTSVADRPAHDGRYAISTEKVRNQLDWRPRTSLEAGILHTVDAALADNEWYEGVRSGKIQLQRRGLPATPNNDSDA